LREKSVPYGLEITVDSGFSVLNLKYFIKRPFKEVAVQNCINGFKMMFRYYTWFIVPTH
jgi:hypothetical protein